MILLDTHKLVHYVSGDATLPYSEALLIAEQADGEVLVSAISLLEIAQLVSKERLTLPVSIRQWLTAIEERPAFRVIPLDAAIAAEAYALPGEFHKDPADRIIVATARVLDVPLLTSDELIRRYPHVRPA